MIKAYLALLFRVALGIIFIVAALPKITDPSGFALSIANYHLMPHQGINLLAIILPVFELLLGLALIIGLSIRPALVWIALLLVVFIVAIGIAMYRGLDISCGCFSVATEKTASMTRSTLIWDIVFLAMSIFSFIYDRALLSCDKVIKKRFFNA